MKNNIKKFYNYVKNFNKDSKADSRNFNSDSFVDYYTGINYNSRSGSSVWDYRKAPKISRSSLDDMYNRDGIAKRVIDSYVEEALRSFIDTDSAILEELERLKLKEKLFDGARDARLFGGALLVVFVDDGKDLIEELDYANINKLIYIKSYDRHQVTWSQADLIDDYLNENFGEPEFYTIQNYASNTINSISFKVHKSRVFKLRGEQTTEVSRAKNDGWDNSCLLSIFDRIQRFSETSNVTAEIIQGYVETVIKVPNMVHQVKNDDTFIARRNFDLNRSKSAFKTIFIDATEEYQKHPTNVHGLSEIWDRFAETIASVSGIPVSVLFGRSPAGLNATGKQELELWNNKIEEYRNSQLKPFISWIFKILENQKEGNLKGVDFHWEFHPLITLDEEREARTRKMNADIDKIYVEMGAVDAKTLFSLRYSADQTFNNNIVLTKEDLDSIEKKAEENERLNEADLNMLKEMEKEKEEREEQINKDSEEFKVEMKINDFILSKLKEWENDKSR
jgi:phage-related protein (TIGR01555 family)